MTSRENNVKEAAGSKSPLLAWIDAHPRTGWYICTVVTLDLLLNVLEVVKCPLLN